ncbi:MAG: metallophosphoesterase [Gammaproteobacteria bacterium]|nr:MAG: metallophosphoesterase [Pseudomonadota bacterium]PIE38430.1 MAG: metallophosphoesterase [Gammaproteobacteria bacterium]
MSQKNKPVKLPEYRGKKWIQGVLPSTSETWLLGAHIFSPGTRAHARAARKNDHIYGEVLYRATRHCSWQWPKRQVFFIADAHADADAFCGSLVASGGVRKTGPDAMDYKLTKKGKQGVFVIGGDCLDKGPSNLRLLKSLHKLMKSGANVKLLAGNHDMRLLMGIRSMTLEKTTTTEHFFLRMSPKAIPLLKEIHSTYLKGKHALDGIPGNNECLQRLSPSENWFKAFPEDARRLMSGPAIKREMSRMKRKLNTFEGACKEAGLSIRDVYAAALKCQELFLSPKGEFYWFFEKMRLAWRSGSFLFIHAGLDDRISSMIEREGIGHINKLFRKQIKHNLFDFYFGPLANTMRTKYRKVDLPLTNQGVDRVYRQGIHAIVHGHNNRLHGQRIMLRQGMIHIECDVSLDRNTRKKEGMEGYGMGVTLIQPEGCVIGISKDYPHAKVFQPKNVTGKKKHKRSYG